MECEEALLILCFVVHYSHAGSCKHHVTIGCVFQISSSVPATESMGPFKLKSRSWGLSRSPRFFEARGCACFNLSEGRVNSKGLISSSLQVVPEFTFFSYGALAFFSVVIFFAVKGLVSFAEFISESRFVDFNRLCSRSLLHNWCFFSRTTYEFPLEDALVLSTRAHQITLSGTSGELHIGNMAAVSVILLKGGFFDGAWVPEELDCAKVVSCCTHQSVGRSRDCVNIRAICRRWKDTHHREAERASPGCPLFVLQHAATASLLLARLSALEEDLVGKAVGH